MKPSSSKFLLIIFLGLVSLISHSSADQALVQDPQTIIASQQLQFNDAEKDWIKTHPIIYYSDFSWMPYISVENKVEGIAKDYLDLVIQETGIDFRFVPTENWQTLLKELKDGNITLSLAAGKTAEREVFADFTESYISSPLAIITSDNYSYVEDLKQLEGLTVAIPTSLFIVDFLKKEHPKINLTYTDTIRESFQVVAEGGADAYVGNMAVAAYYLRESNLTNLKIAGSIDHHFTIHFMLRKGNPELISIFNKVIKSVTDEQRRTINNRWFAINFNQGIDPKTIWQVVLTGLVLILVVLYWVGRLKKEIALRKLTELSLKSARVDADRANKAKSEFLANMSHEIRTPMNAVIGFTQLMLETELTTKQQNYLDSIKVGGNGLLHIINDILDLSKIEAGKLSIEFNSIDFYKLLDEIHQVFESSMRNKGLTFSTNVAADVPKYLVLDGNRVRQVLLNLIGNAQKFTDEGSVSINVYSNRDSNDKVSINLSIQIKDSGIGIEPGSMDQIFKNFEQHKNLNTQKYGGTGLGLAISRKLAEKMNGALTATSDVGEGSTFTLQLNQVAIADTVSENIPMSEEYHFETAVVLVVDDVDTNRMVVCKYLEPFPFELVEARNGVEAVKLALKVKPDLILMDLRMPEMDGYEATKTIKNKLDVPVIALTASALEDKDSKKERNIFDEYLRKPILKTKLLNNISRFLGHRIVGPLETDPSIELIVPKESFEEFKTLVNGRLLTKVKEVAMKGQFVSIETFADEIVGLSERLQIEGLSQIAEKLIAATHEFDIELIAKLLNQLENHFQQYTE